jgi:hypothetical protein
MSEFDLGTGIWCLKIAFSWNLLQWFYTPDENVDVRERWISLPGASGLIGPG